MQTASKLAHSASNVIPLRTAANDPEAPVRRRLKISYMQVAKPAPAPQSQSRVRRALVHVERLSECVAVGVITQVVTLTLKAYGILS